MSPITMAIDAHPQIAVDPDGLDGLDGLDWFSLFGNSGPVELEIGTGKAGFLLERARAKPRHNFLGIEWANEYYRFALNRMRRWKIANVRMLRTDASLFVRTQCPRDSLVALHVYHPDPWPKRRHHKRRLIAAPFVDAAVDCLTVGGRWLLQTDHAEYFEVMRELLLGHARLSQTPFEGALAHVGTDTQASTDPDTDTGANTHNGAGAQPQRIQTNYEIKYLKEGRSIFQLAVRRVS